MEINTNYGDLPPKSMEINLSPVKEELGNDDINVEDIIDDALAPKDENNSNDDE